MDWTNPIDSAKSTQSNSKKWVGSDNWVDMGLKNKIPHTKIGFGQNWIQPKNPLKEILNSRSNPLTL
jgi:hypothetical protein